MSLKILVVDDEPQVLKLVKTILESLGYEVLALSDSRAAAARLDQEKFNAAFVDAHMPFLDGFMLTRHIRNSTSNGAIPIVMLTAFDNVETMRTAFKAGVTFFQPKPIDTEKLAGLLRVMREAMLRERRSYVRLPLRTVVACGAGPYHFQAVSQNISEGGMMLEGTGGVGVGQEIEVRFSLPGWPAMVNAHATVVRLEHGERMAVRFTSLEPEDRKGIQTYIAGIVKE
jgi:CheY-like chemotaxis protein